MKPFYCSTPVLFIIFNRAGMTQKVFEAIRGARPKRLYVAADGPRESQIGEYEKCLAARDIVLKQVDWDCDVNTLFRDKNLGCKAAVSSGIDWFFKNEEKGIILEDDTLPGATFFRFCEELLEYYKDDNRIMMISGDNFQFGKKNMKYSYYFSRYAHIWGWASWRRAWHYYDAGMESWPAVRDNGMLLNVPGSKRGFSHWPNIFEKVYKGEINTWDYQWLFACWLQKGLTIIPGVNLISNIGFGNNSTHAKGRSMLHNLETKHIIFPLKHPPFVSRDTIADEFTEKSLYGLLSVYKKIIYKISGYFKKGGMQA